jgi:hypothetical protein
VTVSHPPNPGSAIRGRSLRTIPHVRAACTISSASFNWRGRRSITHHGTARGHASRTRRFAENAGGRPLNCEEMPRGRSRRLSEDGSQCLPPRQDSPAGNPWISPSIAPRSCFDMRPLQDPNGKRPNVWSIGGISDDADCVGSVLPPNGPLRGPRAVRVGASTSEWKGIGSRLVALKCRPRAFKELWAITPRH